MLLVVFGAELPRFAFQCKHHAPHKTLPPKELEDEVIKAKTFPERIDEYIVFTTAKRGTKAQLKVSQLNVEQSAKQAFKIQLLTWDDIEPLIGRSPAARQALGLDADDGTIKALREHMAPLHDAVRHVVADAQHGELDEIKSHLDRGEPMDATVLLRRLKRRSWETHSASQRARKN